MKRYLLSFVALALFGSSAVAQDLPSRQYFAISSTFAPDSSHILIGISQQRRIWTAGFEYGRSLWENHSLRLDYEGSITPFFQERDPTIIGAFTELGNGSSSTMPSAPVRVVSVSAAPIGYAGGAGGAPTPIYAIYSSKKTYAFAVSPIGGRISGFNSHQIQPTFSVDLGLVFSSRDLPVDNSSDINFLFSFGPGIEVFTGHDSAVRVEYLYRHLSNANSGNTNPGVDQGVLRLTLSRRSRR